MEHRFKIPAPLRAEHDELHTRLAAAIREPGAVGEAAREVARLLHPHFEREEEFALPPLALLAPLARGEAVPALADVVPMIRRLKEELPAMIQEHQAIVNALDRLRSAARNAGNPEVESFARALVQHAQTEETVLYPAAIVVGELAEMRNSSR
jgi:hypothetical protein